MEAERGHTRGWWEAQAGNSQGSVSLSQTTGHYYASPGVFNKLSALWLQSLDPDQYSWSCNFMCSWSVKEKCHFTIKYNFIVKWTCPKRTLLPLLTVKCWNLEEYHLVSYQVQKIEYWRQQPTSSSVQLILPGPARCHFYRFDQFHCWDNIRIIFKIGELWTIVSRISSLALLAAAAISW